MNRRWMQIALVAVIAITLLGLLLLRTAGPWAPGIWLWLLLLVVIWMLWMLAAGPESPEERQARHRPRMLYPEEQPAVIRELMEVRIALEEADVKHFRGRLLRPADEVYQRLQTELPADVVPLVQEDEELEAQILLMPREVEQVEMERPTRPALHWALFGLTALTTTWAGALHQGVNLLEEPHRFTVGLPYALGLLSILGVHELGHYFTARWHGMDVTPPFFIPVPFALGTFGAFIQMKSPPENRRVLFDVAVAGPLAGLVIAVPALLIGLRTGTVVLVDVAPAGAISPLQITGGTPAGSSIMFALLAKLALPEALQHGCMLKLGPLAFAGWLGLLITGLNLLPIGQLDGGHAARAMLGRQLGETVSTIAMWSLLLLGMFVWSGLLLWAIIVFFLAGRGTPPLNDVTPITPTRRALGVVTFLILAMILIPLPRDLWGAAGIHCPYL